MELMVTSSRHDGATVACAFRVSSFGFGPPLLETRRLRIFMTDRVVHAAGHDRRYSMHDDAANVETTRARANARAPCASDCILCAES